MYHSLGLLPDPDDEVRAYICGEIPVIEFSTDGGRATIHAPGTPTQQSTWLRSLAVQLEELAEQIDTAAGEHLADQHIADAKAAAGIGGA